MNKQTFLENYKGAMIDYLMEEINKKKNGKSEFIDIDGKFKKMKCPSNVGKENRYCGCLKYMIHLGKSVEGAKKICKYIKAQVKKSDYKILKLELENEILKSDKFNKEFIGKLFDKTLKSIKSDELDEVDKMIVSGWIVLRRF